MVVTGISGDQIPEFASITKIVVTLQKNICFYLTKFVTVCFVPRFHSFEVRREVIPENFFISQKELLTYMPAHLIYPFGTGHRNGAYYVVLRFAIPY